MIETAAELAWIAGLLEGEGNFHVQRPRGRGCLVVRFGSTDRDVADTVRTVLGAKKVNTYGLPNRRKPYHCVAVYGQTAREVMQAVYPYMHARRKARIDECLTSVPIGS
jgi:NADPH-dependent glutamate synthase beta subunit-like oxidoreductase